jgi:phosphoribosyl 1,2-cyclic phosphodiesterase
MFTLTVLGSGSAGNCALIASEGCRLLVDAGLSARQIIKRLAQVGVTPDQLDGVLLTHEHGDHASGLEVLCRQFKELPIYCNSLTAEVLRHNSTLGAHSHWRLFATGSDFEIKDFAVQTFPVPHDAVDPAGFVFHRGNAALGFLTDLGFVTKLVHERVREASALLIETNHDSALLAACTKRPWSVKQRIMSRHGHLSNEAAAGVVCQLLTAGSRLQRAILCHLSRDCNRPELAIETMRKQGCGGALEMTLLCAAQGQISEPLLVEPLALLPKRAPEPEPECSRVAETPENYPSQLDLFGALAI